MDTNAAQGSDFHDYAVSKVPMEHRRWHWSSVGNVLIGNATAMFYFAWGGGIAQKFGTVNMIVAMILGTVVIGTAGYLYGLLGGRYGLSSNLLSRELFGKYGSSVTTAIIALQHTVYFAFEGAIMLSAVHTFFPNSPLFLNYVLFAIIMILLGIYGMKAMSGLMWISLPIYVIGVVLQFQLDPRVATTSASTWLEHGGGFSWGGLGAASLSVFALITLSCQAADYGRMLKPEQLQKGSVLLGYGVVLVAFCIVAVIGSYFAVAFELSDPGIYFVKTLGGFGLFIVILTQIRINAVNMYSASLGFVNSLDIVGVKQRVWTRTACSSFSAILGTILIAGGIFHHLIVALALAGLVLMAFGGSIIGYFLLTRRPLKDPEIDLSTLPGYGFVGVTTMIVCLVVTVPIYFGAFGSGLHAAAGIVNLILALGVPAVICRWWPQGDRDWRRTAVSE